MSKCGLIWVTILSLIGCNLHDPHYIRWFFWKIARAEAERCLLMPFNHHGSYLVCNSESNPGLYSLSIRVRNMIKNYRIYQQEDGAFFLDRDGGAITSFKTIIELITYYQHQAQGLPVRLLHPCITMGDHQTSRLLREKWKIDQRHIKLIKKLWEGEFSEMWDGLLYDVKPVAVTIRKPQIMTQSNFLQMASLMDKLHHPRLISFYGMCTNTENEPTYIITEPMMYDNLLNYLRKKKANCYTNTAD